MPEEGGGAVQFHFELPLEMKKRKPLRPEKPRGLRGPLLGVQAIRVARIRSKAEKDETAVERAMDVLSNGLPEKPFLVYWDEYDWTEGYVNWTADSALVQALRRLDYSIIYCDVQLTPGSSLKGEMKGGMKRVVREEELSEKEKELPEEGGDANAAAG